MQRGRAAGASHSRRMAKEETMEVSVALSEQRDEPQRIDLIRSRFPYCITWTPIPIISWLIPCIGHVGIASSTGVIYDFAGPFMVNEDHMAFGRPTKFVRLSPTGVYGEESWDSAVASGSEKYRGRMHNLCCDNCHSHVAECLNRMNYRGHSGWNMVSVFFLTVAKSEYVSFGAFIKTYLPFLIIVGIILVAVFAR
eukprot:m.105727 g.105727  ORF g.105727 m.105727 type:complete len:196 (+) comp9157_c0_seq1:2033-2620(+)